MLNIAQLASPLADLFISPGFFPHWSCLGITKRKRRLRKGRALYMHSVYQIFLSYFSSKRVRNASMSRWEKITSHHYKSCIVRIRVETVLHERQHLQSMRIQSCSLLAGIEVVRECPGRRLRRLREICSPRWVWQT